MASYSRAGVICAT